MLLLLLRAKLAPLLTAAHSFLPAGARVGLEVVKAMASRLLPPDPWDGERRRRRRVTSERRDGRGEGKSKPRFGQVDSGGQEATGETTVLHFGTHTSASDSRKQAYQTTRASLSQSPLHLAAEGAMGYLARRAQACRSDSPLKFGKEVILAIDRDETILEGDLPLVLYALDLRVCCAEVSFRLRLSVAADARAHLLI